MVRFIILHICNLLQILNCTIDCCEWNKIGDTITQEDIVKKQYTLLPYPEISQKEMIGTRNHYNSEFAHLPYMSIVAQNLESLNHFLFQGKDNFK